MTDHAPSNGQPLPASADVEPKLPRSTDDGAARSYYGQPIIKEPTWTWEIPNYFFTGGVAGASAGLAYLSELRGNHTLARRAWAVSMSGITISPVFLISDLGRPMRFLNMLRMLKVTSPMSVGSWNLAASGLTTSLAALSAWTGLLRGPGRLAKPAAAALGLPLCVYTAALVSNTAVPVWHEARRELPFVFAAGAALSAGALTVAATPVEDAAPARRLALGGAAAELALEAVMEKRLGEHGEPYHARAPHRFALASRVLIALGSGLLVGAGRRSRRWAQVAGGLMGAGALATRWSVYKAGFVSARDPRYVVGPQRRSVEAGRRAGAARTTPQVVRPDLAQATPATSLPHS